MKMTKYNISGTYVVTSNALDAQVYLVKQQHEVNKAMYLLVYKTAYGEVSGGWCDISMMQPPSGEKLAKYILQLDRILAGEDFAA